MFCFDLKKMWHFLKRCFELGLNCGVGKVTNRPVGLLVKTSLVKREVVLSNSTLVMYFSLNNKYSSLFVMAEISRRDYLGIIIN